VEFPADLNAVALDDGRGVSAVLQALLVSLDRWLTADDVLPALRQRDALRGRDVSWGEGSGTAAGIDDSGALLVDTAEGRVALQAGEVHLRL
jgi:biotin-(acetyl-CoA carboxylase) ligase